VIGIQQQTAAVALALVLGFGPAAGAEESPPPADPAWRAPLEDFVAQALGGFAVPGAVVVVVTAERGPVVLPYGVCCAGADDPVTVRTSFPLASLTKAFTATAAATLVAEGLLEWDTPVRTVIPELTLQDSVASERVTLRDLLAHRSGLGDHGIIAVNTEGDPKWLLPRLALLEPAAEFRDRYAYSSLGVALAGEMIGRAARSSWQRVVASRLLEPLGMKATTFGPPSGGDVPISCGHLVEGGAPVVVEPVIAPVIAPASGLYSTGSDLGRWLELQLGKGRAGATSVVGARALAETWTPQVAIRASCAPVRAYGLGWHVSSRGGRRQLSHDGGAIGFTAQVRVYPDDGVAVAVLANCTISGFPDLVAERASELVLGDPPRQGLLELGLAMAARIEGMRAAEAANARASRNPAAPPPLERRAFAGCYSNPAFGELDVRAVEGGLTTRFHGLDLAVEHLHDSVFLLSHPYIGDVPARFHVADGAARSVTLPLGSPQADRVFTRSPDQCR